MQEATKTIIRLWFPKKIFLFPRLSSTEHYRYIATCSIPTRMMGRFGEWVKGRVPLIELDSNWLIFLSEACICNLYLYAHIFHMVHSSDQDARMRNVESSSPHHLSQLLWRNSVCLLGIVAFPSFALGFFITVSGALGVKSDREAPVKHQVIN